MTDRETILAFLVSLLVGALILLFGIAGGWAHDWYSKHSNPVTRAACCGTSDCRIVPAHEIHMTRFAYVHLPTKLGIPREQALISPDEHFHVCIYPVRSLENKLRCIFVPQVPGY